MVYKTFPKGTGGFGNMGDGVDVEFVLKHGTRAQRRELGKHLRRQASKEKVDTAKRGGK